MERMIAAGYGFAYDRIVEPFEPYQRLLGEVRELVARSNGGRPAGSVKVLDVASGTGTVALALARDGYSVVGLDVVERLVHVARERAALLSGAKVRFEHLDVADGSLPGAGTYDVVISMHTLYWHPRPAALLEACRRALRVGGHGIFLTYSRPAHIMPTFRELRTRHGMASAVRGLRWLLPTAVFEFFRDYEPHYLSPEAFHSAIAGAGFEVLESRRTFLADISLLAWVRVARQ